MKKPTFTVVGSAPLNSLSPPASLGKAGAKLWHAIHSDYVVDDAGGREMLARICEAVDSLRDYDEEIARDGVTIRAKTGIREHPLLKHRLAAQSSLCDRCIDSASTSNRRAPRSAGRLDTR